MKFYTVSDPTNNLHVVDILNKLYTFRARSCILYCSCCFSREKSLVHNETALQNLHHTILYFLEESRTI